MTRAEQRATVEALDEVGFWLERDRADTYRIRAYRSAARAVEALSDLDFEQLVDAQAWRAVPGFGPSTVEVINEVLDGKIPSKLAKLRAAGEQPLASDNELVGQLRGDLHSHTEWSDGAESMLTMGRTASQLGRSYLAISDHSPRLRVANGLSAERLAKQIDQLHSTQAVLDGEFDDATRLLTAIEVDILADGSLDQSDAMLGEVEVVVASVHSGLRDDRDTMTKRMISAIANPHTNVLGHCTGRRVAGDKLRPPTQFDAELVFAACAQFDVAVEINSRPERCDPPDELIQLALDAGCLFSIDSDAHAPGQLAFLEYGAERAARLGVPAERIITTWDLGRLLEFCAKDFRRAQEKITQQKADGTS